MSEFQQTGFAIVAVLGWLVLCWLLWRASRKWSLAKRWTARLGIAGMMLLPLLFGLWLITISATMERAPETASMQSEAPDEAAPTAGAPSEPAADESSGTRSFGNAGTKAKRAYRRDVAKDSAPDAGDTTAKEMTTGSISREMQSSEAISDLEATRRSLAPDIAGAESEVVAGEAPQATADEAIADGKPVVDLVPPSPVPPGPAGRSLAPAPSQPAANGASETASSFGGTDDYAAVPIYYGTDRQKDEAMLARVAYSGERASRLELGRAVITVPKLNRSLGQVTRPREITFMGIKVYAEAEDAKRHFTIQEIEVMSEEDYLAKVREQLANSRKFKDQAIVFVHGYNVTFDSALYRTAQIAYDLEFDGVPFLYSWPSRGALTEYEYDQNSSVYARDYLKQFLDMVVERSGAKNVHLIAHSMGNVPLLEALREFSLSASAETAKARINQIILAAPDVDRNGFIAIAERVKTLGHGVTLYASSTDKAMQASRSYAGGIPRAGDVPAEGPIVISGMDTIDVSAMSTEFLGLNHSTYAEKSELLRDMSQMLLLGLRPPEKRLSVLEPIASANGGTFWRVKP